ncbi:MAG TPA: undecaprenyldiphospho-muramoylpentapeptide beta-N-acetylglucosaminyltransferase [Lautropia sp.]|jgi:UDP-N-acetylglucosamine--N-acetylmuramyl-(pentapeptide) pyrophosphoryl-undecaprenol N-acetylglucosamine transferase|nr:undecaprenyldiphospho-muramoylpentapeptide beta-N-acetylglucosaminyltransferase [Lautropia sp.]
MIMAGGTGGHIFPGLAVAELMRQRNWRVVWLGNPSGMEARLVPQRGIEMKAVNFGGLRGKGLTTMFFLPLNLLRAFWQSLRAVRQADPAVVLGMGGYITFPGGMMAVLLGRPLVLHEQNSVAGLANKVLARISDRILVAFPATLPNSRWSGNPVAAAIAAVAPPEQRYPGRTGPLRVLVVGGSLGARVFNQVLPQALGRMPPSLRPVIVHQSGRTHIEELRANYAAAAVDAEAVDFIDDMAAAYAEADLVIARAGAMTVSEIACVGVASVLVPFPHAVDDHQTGNARFLSSSEAAFLIPQERFTAESLADLLSGLNRETLASMAAKARAHGKPDAAETVADACESLARVAVAT